MKMREITYPAQPPIDGYGPGGFRIGGTWHAGSVLLGPGGVAPVRMPLVADGPAAAAVIDLAGTVDVVLVGQGAEIAPLAPGLREAFDAAGIGVEIMATPSACRTYNVLLAEDRRVAVVLTAL